MVKCVCSKEIEIAEMHSDIKYIRKVIEGNGKAGLIDNVLLNTEHRIKSQTTSNLLKYAVGSGWLITIVSLVMALITK